MLLQTVERTTAAEPRPMPFAGDRLLEDQCREDEGEDRHRRSHDTGIHRAGEAEPNGEAALIAHESEDSADGKELIPLLHAPWSGR